MQGVLVCYDLLTKTTWGMSSAGWNTDQLWDALNALPCQIKVFRLIWMMMIWMESCDVDAADSLVRIRQEIKYRNTFPIGDTEERNTHALSNDHLYLPCGSVQNLLISCTALYLCVICCSVLFCVWITCMLLGSSERDSSVSDDGASGDGQ